VASWCLRLWVPSEHGRAHATTLASMFVLVCAPGRDNPRRAAQGITLLEYWPVQSVEGGNRRVRTAIAQTARAHPRVPAHAEQSSVLVDAWMPRRRSGASPSDQSAMRISSGSSGPILAALPLRALPVEHLDKQLIVLARRQASPNSPSHRTPSTAFRRLRRAIR
jgi:hypothetical protein